MDKDTIALDILDFVRDVHTLEIILLGCYKMEEPLGSRYLKKIVIKHMKQWRIILNSTNSKKTFFTVALLRIHAFAPLFSYVKEKEETTRFFTTGHTCTIQN